MGVVHNGLDAAVGVGEHLHPPGHPGPHQAVVHRPVGDMQGLAHGDDPQGVLHVEQSGHGQPELPLIGGGAHLEHRLAVLFAHRGSVHVRLGILLGEGDHRLPGGLGGGEHLGGVVAVQVDAVHLGLAENFQLGGEVVLEVRVLDGGDVVVADVEKTGGGKFRTQGAVVLQRLAGHLHGQVLQPRLCGVGQVPLEVQGLRSGQVGLKALRPVVGVDGGDDPRLPLALAGAVRVQHRL